MVQTSNPVSERQTPAQPPPVVRIEAVSKRYGNTAAVDDVSLDIGNEFFSLLGPSGSGKTTLLRIIGGFVGIDSGRVTIAGRDVSDTPAFRRPCNTVFQQYALFPHLSVADNVAFGLKESRVPRADRKNRVHEALEMVQMVGTERRRPDQLSGGQQQRIALARALVNRPAVLLLDEPLAALDAQLRKNMQLELKRLQQEVGITFIYVTHDQEEALVMSDRIAVLDHGRIQQLGTPQSVYDEPGSQFVAKFIGQSNLVPALEVVENDGERAQVRLASGHLVSATGHAAPSGAPGQLMVRPEDVRLSATPPDDRSPATLPGRIRSQTYLGSGLRVEVDLGGVTVVAAVAKADAAGLQVGEDVWVSWSSSAARFLPDNPLQQEAANGGRGADLH
jgi:spermidine/putrescine transport system ATP-binding protein